MDFYEYETLPGHKSPLPTDRRALVTPVREKRGNKTCDVNILECKVHSKVSGGGAGSYLESLLLTLLGSPCLFYTLSHLIDEVVEACMVCVPEVGVMMWNRDVGLATQIYAVNVANGVQIEQSPAAQIGDHFEQAQVR